MVGKRPYALGHRFVFGLTWYRKDRGFPGNSNVFSENHQATLFYSLSFWHRELMLTPRLLATKRAGSL